MDTQIGYKPMRIEEKLIKSGRILYKYTNTPLAKLASGSETISIILALLAWAGGYLLTQFTWWSNTSATLYIFSLLLLVISLLLAGVQIVIWIFQYIYKLIFHQK